MRQLQSLWAIFLMVFFLVGCAGLTQPQSLEDKVYWAQGQVTAAYDSIADLAEQGRVTKKQGEDLLAKTNVANEAVQAAKLGLATGDASTALGRLQIAQTILLQLEVALKEREAKK
jgi:hypothetical protein